MKAGAYDYDEDEKVVANKKSNGLPIWGNEKSMNLNPLILTNIQSSQYFKVNLYQLKTYHEVIDEIYYNVSHLEPWEKGSRKTSGQTGMCGGVRGVGAGGIVSTAFCILYKLYTLRLSRKQVLGLLNHSDSPYIRGLGFMYIRYTQPPADLWDWFEPYLDDEEEIDIRAGGGQSTTVGQMVRQMLSKLDWYSTLFPRIPVPIQKDLEKKLSERLANKPPSTTSGTFATQGKNDRYGAKGDEHGNKQDREYSSKDRDYDRDQQKDREREHDRDKGRDKDKSFEKERERDRDHDRKKERSRERSKEHHRERNGDYDRGRDRQRERDRDHDRHRNRDKERRRSRSRSRDRKHHHRSDRYAEERGHRDFADLLEREKHRIKKERKREGSRDRHHKSRSKSHERHRRSRSHEQERKHRY